MFLLVRPDKTTRGIVNILMIIARDDYESTDKMYVIKAVGVAFDYYIPLASRATFEASFRSPAEVRNCFVFYYHILNQM